MTNSNIEDEALNPSWHLSFKESITKKWPHGEDGEPEKPAFLTHCSSVNMEDRIVISMLDAYGIPTLKFFPENGCFGKIILGISGEGSDIYVPASLLEDAKALLEENEENNDD